MVRRELVGAALIVLLAATCGSNTGTPASVISWERLHNPILGYPDLAVKDPALVRDQGRWVAAFSAVSAKGQWRIGIATSSDLRLWSPLAEMPHDPAIEGEASPDAGRAPHGDFVVTYQSFVHDRGGGQAKLYYRTTRDLRIFSPARPLAHELHPGTDERMIDGALAWTPAGLLLAYKYGPVSGRQAFELARSSTGTLDGPWALVGRPTISVYGDTVENYQFVRFEGRWYLIATSNAFNRPFLFELAGDPSAPRGWLVWSRGRELAVPQEGWNPGTGTTGVTFEHANSAYLLDQRVIDGHFYLLYADSPELTSFGGQGHARLGLARSADLERWSVPPN
jgi:hypothetical protein